MDNDKKQHLAIGWRRASVMVLFSLILIILVWQSRVEEETTLNQTAEGTKAVIVIDPGHGGFDPGKVGTKKTLEKDINLAIAKKVQKKLMDSGYTVSMTRSEDVALCTGNESSKKLADMKNRVALIDKTKPALAVSIHQNSLPQVPSVHGAQVFYGETAGSLELAEAVQAALNQTVNDRAKGVKAAGGGVYLLKKAEIPAILVECGFLSNGEETALLNTQAHQNRLAVTILASVLGHLNQPSPAAVK